MNNRKCIRSIVIILYDRVLGIGHVYQCFYYNYISYVQLLIDFLYGIHIDTFFIKLSIITIALNTDRRY